MRPGMLVTHPDKPGVVFTLTGISGDDLAGRTPDPAYTPSRTYALAVDGHTYYVPTSPVPLPPCPRCGPWYPGVTQLVDGEWVTGPDWQPVGHSCRPDCLVGPGNRAGGVTA